MTIPKITLIGVGLLGGSIGLAARQRGVAGQVTGLVRRAESVEECRAAGAVDEALLRCDKLVEGVRLVGGQLDETHVGDKLERAVDAVLDEIGHLGEEVGESADARVDGVDEAVDVHRRPSECDHARL